MRQINERRRVLLSYDRARSGAVIQEGEEVSDVQWDDGSRQFVPNERLITVTNRSEKK